MPIQTINIGYLANDGTGDDLREAFIKVNDNFAEMSSLVENAVVVEVESVGTGTSIYKSKFGSKFQFKSLIDGYGIQLTESGNEVTITGDPGLEELLIVTDNGSIILPGGKPILPIQLGQNISTSVEVFADAPSNLKINVTGDGLLSLDPHPQLGGNLIGGQWNINDINTVTANTFKGELEGDIWGIDIRDIDSLLLGFDFGGMTTEIRSLTEYLAKTNDIDMLFFTNDEPLMIDGGIFRDL